ncbi:MAG: FHA domain-containing protein [Myxococcales bacterium]|nr:FHA domain-containing protein [Myxococcales bacterium]
MARSSTRSEFIAACSFPFLIGRAALVKPRMPQRTMTSPSLDWEVEQPSTINIPRLDVAGHLPARPLPPLMVLAVRKIQEAFPAMITVGRTANNDIVLNDVQISKFHAFFRVTGSGFELCDAGSRNGTWIENRGLKPKGPPLGVHPGEMVRVGHLDFRFLDAGACWDELRAPANRRTPDPSPGS